MEMRKNDIIMLNLLSFREMLEQSINELVVTVGELDKRIENIDDESESPDL